MTGLRAAIGLLRTVERRLNVLTIQFGICNFSLGTGLTSFAGSERLTRGMDVSVSPSARARWRVGRSLTSGVLGTCLLLLGTARAEAAPITWHWSGPVTGYTCTYSCDDSELALRTAVPLGTRIDLSLSFDHDFPTYPYASFSPCVLGFVTATLGVLGRTYTAQGEYWQDGRAFGGGVCYPGSNSTEVVVPGWGGGGPPLPEGLVPLGQYDYYLPGLWWTGHFTDGQPTRIGFQLPLFYRSEDAGYAEFQRFRADLQPVPVPEPSTWLLLSTALSAAAARRGFRLRSR